MRRIGLLGGVNNSYYKGSISAFGVTLAEGETDSVSGTAVGGFLEFPIKDKWSLELGAVMVTGKGFKSVSDEDEFTFNQMQPYVLVRTHAGKDSPFNAGIGFYTAQLQGEVTETDAETGEETTHDDLETIPTTSTDPLLNDDFGLVLSLQVVADVSSSLGIILDLRYLYGLKNVYGGDVPGVTFNWVEYQGFLGLGFGF